MIITHNGAYFDILKCESAGTPLVKPINQLPVKLTFGSFLGLECQGSWRQGVKDQDVVCFYMVSQMYDKHKEGNIWNLKTMKCSAPLEWWIFLLPPFLASRGTAGIVPNVSFKCQFLICSITFSKVSVNEGPHFSFPVFQCYTVLFKGWIVRSFAAHMNSVIGFHGRPAVAWSAWWMVMEAVLLYCLGEDDDEDDDNKHSTAYSYDDHLLQKERREGKDVNMSPSTQTQNVKPPPTHPPVSSAETRAKSCRDVKRHTQELQCTQKHTYSKLPGYSKHTSMQSTGDSPACLIQVRGYSPLTLLKLNFVIPPPTRYWGLVLPARWPQSPLLSPFSTKE